VLYDFYHHQTVKKPGSVHATYLMSGILIPADVPCNGNNQQEDGDDALMQSSPFVSSQVQAEEDTEIPPPVKLITLVREEDLEGTG
jgi:DNA polymerase delta subunit 3